jgi:beta-phosphoglucomutase-like phosphatase (HAD superfamily)
MSVAHAPTRAASSGATPGAARPSAVRLAAVPPARPLELDTVASLWQRALDSAQRALSAEAGVLPAAEIAHRQRSLTRERQDAAEMLADLARVSRIRPAPWLSPIPVTTELLGLPSGTQACLFDLDGVLTDSGLLHAWAWGEVFDDFLLGLSERTGWHFIPFDRVADYRAFVDGRRRLDAIHVFLGSRGIRLPEGRAGDPVGADTAYGLARRKGEMIERELLRRRVSAVAGARRFLEAAGHAGLARAVISASQSTSAMLERSGLTSLLDARIDADVIREEGLESPPSPDLVLAACRRLGVSPSDTVSFSHSPVGVAAAHRSGLFVIGIGDEAQAELLALYGAKHSVASLGALLDRRLRSA